MSEEAEPSGASSVHMHIPSGSPMSAHTKYIRHGWRFSRKRENPSLKSAKLKTTNLQTAAILVLVLVPAKLNCLYCPILLVFGSLLSFDDLRLNYSHGLLRRGINSQLLVNSQLLAGKQTVIGGVCTDLLSLPAKEFEWVTNLDAGIFLCV